MRFVKLFSAMGLAFGLAGCGVTTSQVTKELNRFGCRSADFARIDAAVSKLIKDADYSSADRGLYDMFESFNAKLASKCGAPVLAKCSPGAQRVGRGGIVGPVNSLGVSGYTEYKTVWRHDGMARSPEQKAYYNVSVNAARYRDGLACFSKAAP